MRAAAISRARRWLCIRLTSAFTGRAGGRGALHESGPLQCVVRLHVSYRQRHLGRTESIKLLTRLRRRLPTTAPWTRDGANPRRRRAILATKQTHQEDWLGGSCLAVGEKSCPSSDTRRAPWTQLQPEELGGAVRRRFFRRSSRRCAGEQSNVRVLPRRMRRGAS